MKTSLTNKIRRIDKEFAASLEERKSVAEIIRASPWAWFAAELKNIMPSFSSYASGLGTTRAYELFERIIGYKQPATALRPFVDKGTLNEKILKTSNMVYARQAQAMRRVLLEYSLLDEKQQPLWFKVVIYLCRERRERSVVEIGKGTGVKSETLSHTVLSTFPDSVLRDFMRSGSKRRRMNSYIIRDDFRENVYLPIAPWLQKDGLRVFKEWKKEYHFPRPENGTD